MERSAIRVRARMLPRISLRFIRATRCADSSACRRMQAGTRATGWRDTAGCIMRSMLRDYRDALSIGEINSTDWTVASS
jgi:hypothetical protein